VDPRRFELLTSSMEISIFSTLNFELVARIRP